MPQIQEHPTSLPRGPIRDCLEELRAAIVMEMNDAQSQPGRKPDIDASTLGAWVNRLTEAIHFNGAVAPAVSGIDNTPRSWAKLNDAMVHLSYIGGAPLHASHALVALGEFRQDLYKKLVTAADRLERYTERLMTIDLDFAHAAIKDVHKIIITDILGLR